MRLVILKKNKTVKNMDKVFVHVTDKEALKLILSLSSQLSTGDLNTEREETYTEDGIYFTIVISER